LIGSFTLLELKKYNFCRLVFRMSGVQGAVTRVNQSPSKLLLVLLSGELYYAGS
jgi:hypothetical protein